jgi:RNA polymerase sigma factor (sigma-70 family)
MQELDDNALLREYVEHDSQEAFAALVGRHVNKVYSVALRHTRNPHQAEEITQAVFVILAQKSRKLGNKVILSGWLYQTARLTALTFIRSEIRRTHREQEAYMQTLLNETKDDAWPQIAPLLDAAMAGLSEKDRYAIVLRYFDGKSMKEIGASLGATEDATKMRVNRATEKLQNYLMKRGVTSTAATIAGTISTNSVQAAPAGLAETITAVALAKGATASLSTSTLIKEALKFMAWTKAKTVAVTGAAVVLVGASIPLAGMTVIALQNPPGQIGWWKLNQGSGTTISDSSRLFGHSGKILHDGFQWVKGRQGEALQLTGRQHVLLGNIYQGGYNQISIACWIRMPSASWESIVERSSWDNPDGIGLWADYLGHGVSFGHYLTGYVRSQTTVQDDQWHHVVGTMAKSPDGYVYSIYVDGNLDNTMTNTVGLASTTRPWTIGGRYDGSWRYSGVVSDVRIFDKALSPAEVRRIYHQ